tara:strand:+ start:198 stop:413 length:216 start_codon:yes stop_codon:yes gene_type:complete
MTDITITEEDLSTVLRTKVNEVTNLQVMVASLQRTISEKDTYIAELEDKASSVNGKEASDAKGRKEEVPVQ